MLNAPQLCAMLGGLWRTHPAAQTGSSCPKAPGVKVVRRLGLAGWHPQKFRKAEFRLDNLAFPVRLWLLIGRLANLDEARKVEVILAANFTTQFSRLIPTSLCGMKHSESAPWYLHSLAAGSPLLATRHGCITRFGSPGSLGLCRSQR